ncbi:MAG: glucans biosynthesis glucosyltransferase MdoH [Pseudomonadota bacterium]
MELTGVNARVTAENGPEPLKLTRIASGQQQSPNYRRRRSLFVTVNLLTVMSLLLVMVELLRYGGWHWTDTLLLISYGITLPWLSIGFWNAVIGFTLAAFSRDPIAQVAPCLQIDENRPVTSHTAIVMTVRNEDPSRWLTRLRAVQESIAHLPHPHLYDFHVLSDTDQPAIAAQEARLVEEWRRQLPDGVQLFYRHRETNTGYKAGNVMEFCARCREDYEYFIPLDADSLMSGAAIQRLVQRMEANPQIGILQSLAVGMPSDSGFARVFQFGMRHGMRSFTLGSAWWQGDCGPFWGHNAVVRMKPFADHCHLPHLGGAPPLGGHILSHDQVEAVLMRRAGYEVRVWPMADESFEENPPSLPDFVKRQLRWCQGNMQYFPLLSMPGLKTVSRVQLALAILMFTGAPAWMFFILTGAVQTMLGHFDLLGPAHMMAGAFPTHLGVGLFVTVLTLSLAPKLMGVASILCSAEQRQRYGGGLIITINALIEFVVSALTAPVVAFCEALFMAGLPFGRQIKWDVQRRDGRAVSWLEATRAYLPQTLFGAALAVVFMAFNPSILPWAAPLLLGFTLAIPLTVMTASSWFGQFCVRTGLFAIPEDRDMPAILRHIQCRGHSTPAIAPPTLSVTKSAA